MNLFIEIEVKFGSIESLCHVESETCNSTKHFLLLFFFLERKGGGGVILFLRISFTLFFFYVIERGPPVELTRFES
jgi:hypothetical protein